MPFVFIVLKNEALETGYDYEYQLTATAEGGAITVIESSMTVLETASFGNPDVPAEPATPPPDGMTFIAGIRICTVTIPDVFSGIAGAYVTTVSTADGSYTEHPA